MTHISLSLSAIRVCVCGGGPPAGSVCVRCSLTDEACIHSSVKVIGESVEDAAVLQFVRLVDDPLHHFEDLLVTQLVSCIT